MTITLCGSLKFMDEIEGIDKKLKALGHRTFLPIKTPGIDYWDKNYHLMIEPPKRFGLFGKHMKMIEQSDAILVANFPKGEIENYIGANTFIEMAFARYLGKKVFLLNPLPNQYYIADELESMEPVVLDGNLKKIK